MHIAAKQNDLHIRALGQKLRLTPLGGRPHPRAARDTGNRRRTDQRVARILAGERCTDHHALR